MTTLTGSTAQTLAGTVSPPTFPVVIAGAIAQFGILASVWLQYTPLGQCASERTASACLREPWSRQVLLTLAIGSLMWLWSLRTIRKTGVSDPSLVDRVWSVLPWLYTWHLYLSSPTPRLLLMAVLSTAWGVRLTANFAIKGGFSGGEDYRWQEIRSWPGFEHGWYAPACTAHSLARPSLSRSHRLNLPCARVRQGGLQPTLHLRFPAACHPRLCLARRSRPRHQLNRSTQPSRRGRDRSVCGSRAGRGGGGQADVRIPDREISSQARWRAPWRVRARLRAYWAVGLLPPPKLCASLEVEPA